LAGHHAATGRHFEPLFAARFRLHFGHFRLLSIKVGHYTARHASVAGRADEQVVYACQPELASPNQTAQRVKLLFRICI
jgi:hypothetical protein